MLCIIHVALLVFTHINLDTCAYMCTPYIEIYMHLVQLVELNLSYMSRGANHVHQLHSNLTSLHFTHIYVQLKFDSFGHYNGHKPSPFFPLSITFWACLFNGFQPNTHMHTPIYKIMSMYIIKHNNNLNHLLITIINNQPNRP